MDLARTGGISVTQLVNTRGQTYKKIRPDLAAMGEEDIVRLIQDNPSIMVRPILTDGASLITGFREAEYRAFLDRAAPRP